jgi:hypothetical protein
VSHLLQLGPTKEQAMQVAADVFPRSAVGALICMFVKHRRVQISGPVALVPAVQVRLPWVCARCGKWGQMWGSP